MSVWDASHDRVVNALKKAGFYVLREGKHTNTSDGVRVVQVPRHPRLNRFTLERIYKGAGLTREEFRKLL